MPQGCKHVRLNGEKHALAGGRVEGNGRNMQNAIVRRSPQRETSANIPPRLNAPN